MLSNECGIEVKRQVAKKYVPVRIDPTVIDEVEKLGSRFGFNVSEYIRTALDEKLERDMAKLGQVWYAQ